MRSKQEEICAKEGVDAKICEICGLASKCGISKYKPKTH